MPYLKSPLRPMRWGNQHLVEQSCICLLPVGGTREEDPVPEPVIIIVGHRHGQTVHISTKLMPGYSILWSQCIPVFHIKKHRKVPSESDTWVRCIMPFFAKYLLCLPIDIAGGIFNRKLQCSDLKELSMYLILPFHIR